MALPSQRTPVGAAPRRMMSSRRRRRRSPILGLLVVAAAIAAGVWLIWPALQTSSSDEATHAPIAMTFEPDQPASTTATPAHEASTGHETTPIEPVVTPTTQPTPHTGAALASPPRPDATAAAQPPAPASSELTTSTPTDEATPDLGDSAAAAEPEAAPTAPPAPATPSAMAQAAGLIRAGDIVQARAVLSDALRGGNLSDDQADQVRATAAALNEGLVFGPEITPGDPYSRLYEIKPGDALSRISGRENTGTSWRFIQRINDISDPARIRVGQRIKLVQGPFHARVDKQNHRLDLWLGEPDAAVYVRSFNVGLGEYGSTPLGAYRVRRGGKLINPEWRNPRTGEYFGSNNPENPIGEFWIGLDGIEPHNLQERGFGVHGTIDPESIGEDRSMGCVRLADGDIDLLYEMLSEGKSLVVVHGQ